MIVIGVDPGTACGWAVLADGKRQASGVWDLKPRRHEGGGMRYVRVRRNLVELIEGFEGRPIVLGYEEVRRHMGVDAAHVYGGIIAMIGAVCEERDIPYQGVGVGAVKAHATGKGNASKEAMVAAAVARWGPVADDNEADALWIAAVLEFDLVVPF